MDKFKRLINDNLHLIVIIISGIFGILSFFHYYSTSEHLMYGDARSHLNIARRVVDSTHPGFAQLGGVWLPLLHVLMLPTIINEFMWHSGISGSIVNFISLILATFFLYKIGEILFQSTLERFIIPFFYLLNPNILYMSTTAMTEVLFMATFTGAIFFFLRWIYRNRLIDLILSAFFIMLTSINRYEGWSIVVSATFTVILISFIKGVALSKLEGNIILFSFLAWLGIFFWLIWNASIFGDPFYFLNSIYSAKYQTAAGFKVVGTKSELLHRNLILAPLAYLYAVLANTGWIVTIGGIIGGMLNGLLLPFIRRNSFKLHHLLLLFLLITPYLFESFAIYRGNVPLHVPQINGGTFNIRLGMYTTPSAVILLLFLIKLLPFKAILLLIVIIFQTYLFSPVFTHPITLQAAGEGIEPKIQTAKWLKTNYKGGKILVSSATGDPLLFDSGLNLKEFITDGSAELFDSALTYPEGSVRYIVLTNQPVDRLRDLVYINLNEKPKLRENYKTIFNNKSFEILEKK